jgi:hypothetical protein
MGADCVMLHELTRNLFGEGRLEAASNVDCRKLSMLALVVCFQFRTLKGKLSLFRISL